MSRRIITVAPQSGGEEGLDVSSYTDKVVGYIPADVVAGYAAAAGLITGAENIPGETLLWVVFIVGLIFTPLWTHLQTKKAGKDPATVQIIISTLAFLVWVFTLGGPFVNLSWYNAIYGSLLLIGYTLLVPLIPVKQE